MKSFSKLIVMAAVFCPLFEAHAQGTLYYSGSGSPVNGETPVDSTSFAGQVFETGNNPGGYELNSVQLPMGDASGSPAGFSLSLYTQGNSAPSQYLGTLTGSSNPSAAEIYSYTTTGIYLAPSTEYCFVASAATPYPNGVFYWVDLTGAEFSIDGWKNLGEARSSNGINWTEDGRVAFASDIYATAVPEPSIRLLLSFEGIVIMFSKMRKNQSA